MVWREVFCYSVLTLQLALSASVYTTLYPVLFYRFLAKYLSSKKFTCRMTWSENRENGFKCKILFAIHRVPETPFLPIFDVPIFLN